MSGDATSTSSYEKATGQAEKIQDPFSRGDKGI